MSDGRFRITGVRVGSAARRVEQEALVTPSASSVRVRAGSAARMAEDAKRQAGDSGSSTAGFSLRGQGGRVVRREELSSSPQREASLAATHAESRSSTEETAKPGAAATQTHVAFPFGEVDPVPAVPLQSTVGLLQSMFRALFKPAEPPSN